MCSFLSIWDNFSWSNNLICTDKWKTKFFSYMDKLGFVEERKWRKFEIEVSSRIIIVISKPIIKNLLSLILLSSSLCEKMANLDFFDFFDDFFHHLPLMVCFRKYIKKNNFGQLLKNYLYWILFHLLVMKQWILRNYQLLQSLPRFCGKWDNKIELFIKIADTINFIFFNIINKI